MTHQLTLSGMSDPPSSSAPPPHQLAPSPLHSLTSTPSHYPAPLTSPSPSLFRSPHRTAFPTSPPPCWLPPHHPVTSLPPHTLHFPGTAHASLSLPLIPAVKSSFLASPLTSLWRLIRLASSTLVHLGDELYTSFVFLLLSFQEEYFGGGGGRGA